MCGSTSFRWILFLAWQFSLFSIHAFQIFPDLSRYPEARTWVQRFVQQPLPESRFVATVTSWWWHRTDRWVFDAGHILWQLWGAHGPEQVTLGSQLMCWSFTRYHQISPCSYQKTGIIWYHVFWTFWSLSDSSCRYGEFVWIHGHSRPFYSGSDHFRPGWMEASVERWRLARPQEFSKFSSLIMSHHVSMFKSSHSQLFSYFSSMFKEYFFLSALRSTVQPFNHHFANSGPSHTHMFSNHFVVTFCYQGLEQVKRLATFLCPALRHVMMLVDWQEGWAWCWQFSYTSYTML